MSFESTLTDAQRMVRGMVRDFCKQEIAPIAAETDRGKFPAETLKKMGALGLMGLPIPEEYGGAGADMVSFALAAEEVAAACPSTGTIFAAHTSLVCEPLYHFGSDYQKETFLRPLASGEKLGCFALTEPGVGSDAAGISTAAARAGEHWRIDGGKRFITNGKEADLCLLFTVTDKSRGHKGISAFIVDTKSPGFEMARSEEKLGLGGSSAAELLFDGMEVPLDNLLGEEGQGFEVAMKTLDSGRIVVCAQATGFARACLDASVAYARERETFGKPISRYQPIQWKIADMATGVEAARLLYLKAARLFQEGKPFTAEAAIAKVFASDLAQKSASEAVQIHGGNGFMKDYPVERYYRAAKVTQIYEGTNEILRQVIAKQMLK